MGLRKSIIHLLNKVKYNWSKDRCYADRERSGEAAIGSCYGLLGGDNSTGYLQYDCIGCPYWEPLLEEK